MQPGCEVGRAKQGAGFCERCPCFGMPPLINQCPGEDEGGALRDSLIAFASRSRAQDPAEAFAGFRRSAP